MIVAGIGARKNVTADEVLAVLDAALATQDLPRAAISALASNSAKSAESGIAEAATRLGIACQGLSDELLRVADCDTATRSDASIAATGLASLSEAAALAAVGPGGSLLGPRVALGPVTCALARTGGAS
ncbi:cobalamin biosynthesis protein [Mesorhizobium sp. Z1-4]|uniref:cobalamin biosynthesis protein n=1 Tax=Mesorhizobium sp. Z1-4 TaxID=2448478 RepID=UPI000FD7FC60|nr:cobalamin biosynthesis protein [Mesorhizobium sp. Z1-4]